MNRKITTNVLTICAFALLFGLPVRAQCPASPLSVLAGTWVFHVEGISYSGTAATGKFTATVGTDKAGQPTGILNVVESSNESGPSGNGLVNRVLTYQGSYTIFSDCSGGTLMLNSNFNQRVQYEFYFVPGEAGPELWLVSISGPRFVQVIRVPIDDSTDEEGGKYLVLAGGASKAS